VAALLAGLAAVWWGSVAGRSLESIHEQARVGRTFYSALAGTQLALALLVAPAATAGAMSMDKARGTFSQLLVTDLTAAEIVLGKLGSRLVPVVSVALCALPFLSLGMVLGGFDPMETAGLLMVSLAGAVLGCSLAMALSLVRAKAIESTLLTYGVWLAVLLSPPTWCVLRTVAGVPPWPLPQWLEQTNPVFLIVPPRPVSSDEMFWRRARFVVLALALSTALAGVATARLRSVIVRDASGRRWSRGLRRPNLRVLGPALDDNPVLWRGCQSRRSGFWGSLFWGLYGLLALGCTVTIAWFTSSTSVGRQVACGFLNGLQVSAGMLVLSFSVGSALAEERVRGTLEVLLTTPLSTRSIVWAIWWGSFRAVPMLAVPPGIAVIAVGSWHGNWTGVWLVVCLVVAYAAALCSLGLALAAWSPRPARVAELCAAAHVGITVGWVLCTGALTLRAPGLRGPGQASLSPFMGVMLPTLAMQIAPTNEWNMMVSWLTFWIAVNVAIAALLFGAVLLTFNRFLGRADRQASRAASVRPQSPVGPRT
jgi:ABC-type transport system involved in multi-copper enzyme maturation permease subunit